MLKRTYIFIAAAAVFALLLLARCSEDSPLWSPDGPLVEITAINGLVTDPAGAPLEGVEITTPYETATTDALGLFHMTRGVAIKGRVSVQASREGYFPFAYATQKGEVGTVVKFAMSPKTVAEVNSAAAGSVPIGPKAAVDLPSGGFVDASGNAYSGTVRVSTHHSSPDDPLFRRQMPAGADMAAITAGGEETMLISYGAVAVDLTDGAGNELQLAPGETAEIRMEVSAGQLADAPPTIPLWYFDGETGKWLEEGYATLVGNEYVGEVSHFSWWNCDVPADPRAFVTGRVVDCDGDPVPNVTVNVGPVLAVTDGDGWYSTNVAVGIDFEVWVDEEINFGLQSSVVNVVSVAIGENQMLEDLTIPCPATVSGVLTDCEGNPASGAVTASWAGGSNLVGTAADGSFEVITLGNTMVEVTGVLLDVLTGSQSITSVASQNVGLPAALSVECSSTIEGAFAACGGGSVNGTVYANWDDGSAQAETVGGGFSLLVPGGAAVELQFISNDLFTASTSLVANASGTTDLPGVLEACDELDCGLLGIDYLYGSYFFYDLDFAEVYHEGDTVPDLGIPFFGMLGNGVAAGNVKMVFQDENYTFVVEVSDAVGEYIIGDVLSSPYSNRLYFFEHSQSEIYIANSGSITLELANGVYMGSFDVMNNIDPFLAGIVGTLMPDGVMTGTFCIEDN